MLIILFTFCSQSNTSSLIIHENISDDKLVFVDWNCIMQTEILKQATNGKRQRANHLHILSVSIEKKGILFLETSALESTNVEAAFSNVLAGSSFSHAFIFRLFIVPFPFYEHMFLDSMCTFLDIICTSWNKWCVDLLHVMYTYFPVKSVHTFLYIISTFTLHFVQILLQICAHSWKWCACFPGNVLHTFWNKL